VATRPEHSSVDGEDSHEAFDQAHDRPAGISLAGTVFAAGSAAAQPVTQVGLVKVNLTDVTVQVPIAVPANL
jgi:hypothetical protein